MAAAREGFTATKLTFGPMVPIRDDGTVVGVWIPMAYDGHELKFSLPALECAGGVTPSPPIKGRKPKVGVTLKLYRGCSIFRTLRRVDSKVLRHIRSNAAAIASALEQPTWNRRFENGDGVTTLLTARQMDTAWYPFAVRVSWHQDRGGVRLPATIDQGQYLRARVAIAGVFVSWNIVVVPVKGLAITG